MAEENNELVWLAPLREEERREESGVASCVVRAGGRQRQEGRYARLSLRLSLSLSLSLYFAGVRHSRR